MNIITIVSADRIDHMTNTYDEVIPIRCYHLQSCFNIHLETIYNKINK